MIEKDNGLIQYFKQNLDLKSNIDEIRQQIGLCSQKDVLYDELTAIEHLRFYGNLKGKFGEPLEQEIKSLIPKIGL